MSLPVKLSFVTTAVIAHRPQEPWNIVLIEPMAEPGASKVPGGIVEPEEMPEDGARRELFEETAQRALSLKLLWIDTTPNRARRLSTLGNALELPDSVPAEIRDFKVEVHMHCQFVYVTEVDSEPIPDGNEVSNARFVDIRLINIETIKPSMRGTIERYQKSLQ